MKITKFPQSCVLIESNNTRILIDPGKIKYEDSFLDVWKKADAILITHKHGDHINPEVILKMNKPVFSTLEVANCYPEIDFNIIKEPDVFKIKNIDITVTKAIHGYNPRLKNGGEVLENIGYILNDKNQSVYITSDTICFNNNYKADFVIAPVTGYGLTMSPFETALFAKEAGAKLLIVTHLDNEDYSSDLNLVKKILNENNINYTIPQIGETIDL